MSTETAAPVADVPARTANAPSTEEIAAVKVLTEKNRAIDEDPEANAPDPEVKAEDKRTPEQIENARLVNELRRKQRAIDRKTAQLSDFRAREALTRERQEPNNRPTADDSEPVSLTRAELRELVNAEAEKLAPTLSEQASEVQRRKGVVEGLAKTWGQERFDELASDLDDAFGGLADRAGRPKPATEAVFEADDPKAVIEYLADPEHLEESERIARMGPVQAGKAIAKLEAALQSAKAKDKPRASTAPAPLEPVRGQGAGREKRLGDLSGDAFNKRRQEQIAARKGY